MSFENITDFEYIIHQINDVEKLFNDNSKNEIEILNKIISISKMIIDCDRVDNKSKTYYSQVSVSISDKVNNGHILSVDDINRWKMLAKISVSVAFINLSTEMKRKGTYYVDIEPSRFRFLADFFYEKSKPIIHAHYHAIRRLSYIDPLYCYEKSLEAFSSLPTLFKDLYTDCFYEYIPSIAVDKTYKICSICGSAEADPYYCAEQSALYEKDESCKLYSPAKLWLKCRRCNNLFVYNFPAHSFEEIYNSTQTDVNESIKKVHSPRSYESRYPMFKLDKFSNILNKVKMFNTGDRYLEVGLGTGEMLAVALEMGYDVTAIEISQETCEKLSGNFDIDIYLCDFMKFDIDKKFDVMIMGDVIEHVSQPTDALKKAYDLLDDNGVLWLSTPNYESSFGKYQKYSDPMWSEKQHFTYFSYKGLKPICENFGFTIKRYDVSERYNGSMELILQK